MTQCRGCEAEGDCTVGMCLNEVKQQVGVQDHEAKSVRAAEIARDCEVQLRMMVKERGVSSSR